MDLSQTYVSLAAATNVILSVPLFANLLTCATVIAFNLLLLEVSDHIDFSIAASLYNMSTGVTMALIFCYLSEHITAALLRIGDAFFESIWYRLPPGQQKLVALSINRSQKTFSLKGLGIIYCSLFTFLQVNLILYLFF